VKGGGRTAHRGFSSTSGVHITMSRFSNMTYYEVNQTVDIGAGLTWDDVYKFLQPYCVSVVGGRVWKTNQFGLAIDTVEGYEIVLPNGAIQSVTADTNEDLFFALRVSPSTFSDLLFFSSYVT